MIQALLATGLYLGLWGPEASPAPAPELPSYGGLLLRTVLALAVVILLVWLALRVGLGRLSGTRTATGPLRLLARQPLDGRRQVVLLQATGRYFLLGVAEGQVSLLAELEAGEVAATLPEGGPRPGRRFADLLRRHPGRASGTQAAPTGAQAAPTGTQAAPTGTQAAPTGTQPAPTGTQAARAPRDPHRAPQRRGNHEDGHDAA